MPKPLTTFLKKLIQPEVLSQFREDPKSFIQNANLSMRHKKLLMSKDPQKIAKAVAAEHTTTELSSGFVWVFAIPTSAKKPKL